MIRVEGSSSFRTTVLNALQCLDSRIEYINGNCVSFDPTDQGRPNRRRTRRLLEDLVSSAYLVAIAQTNRGSECKPTYVRATRTGSRVLWNPTQTLTSASACNCIYLGHELCHARQLIRGEVTPGERHGDRSAVMRYEMLTITGRHGSSTAPATAITENHLREEHIPRQRPRTSL